MDLIKPSSYINISIFAIICKKINRQFKEVQMKKRINISIMEGDKFKALKGAKTHMPDL